MAPRIWLLLLALLPGAAAEDVVGRLEPQFEPRRGAWLVSELDRSSEFINPPPQPLDVRLFSAPLRSPAAWLDKKMVVVREYGDGRREISLDADGDDHFQRNENKLAEPSPLLGGHLGATFLVRPDGARATPLPITLLIHEKPNKHELENDTRFVRHNATFEFGGSLPLGGAQVPARFTIDARSGTLDPVRGFHGFDLNEDGQIDRRMNSFEAVLLRGEDHVFRFRETYFSLSGFDVAAGRFTIRLREPSEYRVIETTRGTQVPDFTFTTLDGHERRLSDYRGKYVLLDFWGAWCRPCWAEIPYLVKTYAATDRETFEIIGMNWDEDPGKAAEFAARHGIRWPNARKASIEDTVLRRFRIRSFPVHILIDPAGKIASTGKVADIRLRNTTLLDGLKELMAEPRAGGL